MANCNLTLSGLAPECLSNAGGIKKLWLVEFSKVKSVTWDEDNVELVDIQLDTDAKLLEYSLRKESTQLTGEYTIDDANGIRYCTNSLNIKFPRQSAAKRMEIIAMVSGETAALIQDANGEYYMLGAEEPVTVTTASGDTGTARGDANGYSLTLSDFGSHLAPFVPKELVDKLLGNV